MGVFFNHANFFFHYSEIGVSVFFILSGFLLYIKDNNTCSCSFKENLLFAENRIKKIYPLHVLTAILMFILAQCGVMGRKRRLIHGINLLLNLGLLQSWIPNLEVNTSLNGVAWFLSTIVFLYFCFPIIKNLLRKNKNVVNFFICIIGLFFQIVLTTIYIKLFSYGSLAFYWFTYCFPVFRILDFVIACTIGKIYIEYRDKLSTVIMNILEIIALVAAFLVSWWGHYKSADNTFLALNNWTTVYLPVAAILVFVFAINKGVVTYLLSNKIFIKLGNISSYTFLIHYVVIFYTDRILYEFGIDFLLIDGFNRLFLVMFELLTTIVLSVVYDNYLKDKMNKLFGKMQITKR